MALPPVSLEVGKCYLTNTGQVRRVIQILTDGRVQFERRAQSTKSGSGWAWVPSIADRRAFALLVEREVPCDWTPEPEE